ncbi:hypothetical protein Pst134EA_003388 [Puccinia striiformis f. sp. tritici]|uniref:hypothetical protein n=1 Tax=Puccinia striiformis f. sp. tritici TaxID=168172 RepID=UPI00200837ED|nr:hypothetical protein Pst134EA_003388 [Puccinia striiformis f. sp. tritici]KAH9472784.1 hypothetical protein Pst134EA_003388 [Puccinia striiformis f. sp. tritici]
MSDPEFYPSQTADQVLDDFRYLKEFCQAMREERNGNWPLEALSNAEITLYKTHYINIQQNLLPTLKVELTELLEAFDVQDSLGGMDRIQIWN